MTFGWATSRNTPVPRLSGNPVLGWRPTWQDLGRQYKKLQLLRYSVPGLKAQALVLGFVLVLFMPFFLDCLNTSWLLLGAGFLCSSSKTTFVAVATWKQNFFKMRNVNSVPLGAFSKTIWLSKEKYFLYRCVAITLLRFLEKNVQDAVLWHSKTGFVYALEKADLIKTLILTLGTDLKKTNLSRRILYFFPHASDMSVFCQGSQELLAYSYLDPLQFLRWGEKTKRPLQVNWDLWIYLYGCIYVYVYKDKCLYLWMILSKLICK